MKKIIRYDFCRSGTLDGLAEDVTDSIARGWQPLGGASYSDREGGLWAQTMVVYQE